MSNADKVEVVKNGKTIAIDRLSLATFLEFGYTEKKETAEKKQK